MHETNLMEANLTDAILRRAELADANLAEASLVDTNLTMANLTGTGITTAHSRETTGVEYTLLPPHLKPPAHWIVKTDEQIEED
jgi:uncharacterized protein YjbI with pentapeptide repeats